MKKQILFYAFFVFCLFNSCTKEEILPVIADFEYVIRDNGTVEFYNRSRNADTFEWDFNTGVNSTSIGPTYTFPNNQNYVVTLTARGKYGQNSKSKTIRITNKPTTGQYAFFTTSANSGFIDIYLNGVYEGRLTKYFNFGEPTCGSDGTLTINKPGGIYQLTARSTNGTTWTSNIRIVNGECTLTKFQ